jgi:hypothetical protein
MKIIHVLIDLDLRVIIDLNASRFCYMSLVTMVLLLKTQLN